MNQIQNDSGKNTVKLKDMTPHQDKGSSKGAVALTVERKSIKIYGGVVQNVDKLPEMICRRTDQSQNTNKH